MSRTFGVLLTGVASAAILTALFFNCIGSDGEEAAIGTDSLTRAEQAPLNSDRAALDGPTEDTAAAPTTRLPATPPDNTPWLTVRVADGGGADGMKIYGVDTPLHDGRPRVLAGASEFLGVVGPGGKVVAIKGRDKPAAVVLAYNANCFAVVPINMNAGPSVAEILPAVEQKFRLAWPNGRAAIDIAGKFRFAVILDQWRSLSWPDGAGVDGWRNGVADFFSDYHLGVPVPKSAVHSTFLQFALDPAVPSTTAQLPLETHRLVLIDAPFGWSVVPPRSFVPSGDPIELNVVTLRLRTICVTAQGGTAGQYPDFVRLALKKQQADGRWYSEAMLELPFRPQSEMGCVQYTLPLAYEGLDSSIVVDLPDGHTAESAQFRDIPANLVIVSGTTQR